ncbi:hypothetical protein A0H81_04802 [Grifola frondosa]|uniref:Uncharacterized protein n=1 Tax=Grifola frondosa TaxID=5627 RepID=A0A1C7MFN1_GRIFR|nr:hypothetical protein A0H81_04802 [Grifola frondosa]
MQVWLELSRSPRCQVPTKAQGGRASKFARPTRTEYSRRRSWQIRLKLLGVTIVRSSLFGVFNRPVSHSLNSHLS